MSVRNLLENQAENRRYYLNAILASASPRKLVVAGPGTGKTYTFGSLFRGRPPGKKLALTFIRKLVADTDRECGEVAEVKTFHAYCKMLLHKRYGGIDLIPYLTQVIEEDARAIAAGLADFTDAFQTLKEDSAEVAFYLARGDYYGAVCFDDAVFRVLRAVRQGELTLPSYAQIVVDEVQDFNPLEVALINLLQERGPILIVGDDDQAIYSLRNASPQYLRDKYRSGEYELFELPYCSRCPRAVVEAAAAFVESAIEKGGFAARISRPFVPYLEEKRHENAVYPKVVTATTSTISALANLIHRAVIKIPEDEIRNAREHNYPCALVVGQRKYLNAIYKSLLKQHPNAEFAPSQEPHYSLFDGYKLLLDHADSSLGWRVLVGCDMSLAKCRRVIVATRDGTSLVHLLSEPFIRKHVAVLDILRAQTFEEPEVAKLTELLGDKAQSVLDAFASPGKSDDAEADLSSPTLLFSSFEGCKGLSAGHVFVVGLNNGVTPRAGPKGEIPDIEYSKFLVAMTRARNSLFLLSNRWDFKPSDERYQPSAFIRMIPAHLLADGGYLKAPDVGAFLDATWPATP